MGTLYVDTIEPQSGTALTIGESGQNTVLAGNDIRANIFQDVGGNAIFTSDGSGALSGVNSSFGSVQVLLNTNTVSTAVANIDFTTSITGAFTATYGYYEWHFFNVAGTINLNDFTFLLSSDAGTSWTDAKTGSFQRTENRTINTGIFWGYDSNDSLSNSANPMVIARDLGSATTESMAGIFQLWNVASTTQQKPWIAKSPMDHGTDYTQSCWTGGHTTGTSAITGVRFQMASGNITAGIIKMYGIK